MLPPAKGVNYLTLMGSLQTGQVYVHACLCLCLCMSVCVYMGFTWIHLNQINVGTNVAVGCALYQRWCTLTGVSTCATVNTCTKHKKRCSKGKLLNVYLTYTKDKKHCSEEES